VRVSAQRTGKRSPQNEAEKRQKVSETRRALGTWLEGPPRTTQGHPGDRLGLPESGRGSAASFGEKLLAFVVDLVVASLIGFVIVRPHTIDEERAWNTVSVIVFVILTAATLIASGRTIGMRVSALQVVRRDGQRIGIRAIPRQILVALLIPPLLSNRDRRGLHDRLFNTIVVRIR
jgi:uncharacterized RDD family membrane protein YckC